MYVYKREREMSRLLRLTIMVVLMMFFVDLSSSSSSASSYIPSQVYPPLCSIKSNGFVINVTDGVNPRYVVKRKGVAVSIRTNLNNNTPM
jgi:hypothetical protein